MPGTYEVVVVGAFDAIGQATLNLAAGDVGNLPEADLVSSIQGSRPKKAKAPELPNPAAGTPRIQMSTEKVEKPTTFLSIAPWLTMGIGAVVTGTGGAMMVGVMNDKTNLRKDLESSDGSTWMVDETMVDVPIISYQEAQTRQSDIDSGAQVAQVILGVGGGVLLGSLIWTMISTEEDEDLPLADGGLQWSAPMLSPDGLSVGGTF